MLLKVPNNFSKPVASGDVASHNIRQKCTDIWSTGYIANSNELIRRFGVVCQPSRDELLTFLLKKTGFKETAQVVAGPCSWVFWDDKQKRLHICTDRIGLAPIYYTKFLNHNWFSDDIETLIKFSGLPRRVNPRAVVARINYLRIPVDETLYQDIFLLKPAAIHTYSISGTTREVYWRAELKPVPKLNDDREYAQALRDLLVRVVDEHVPRDNYLLTLSSGMDSSSIAGALRLARPTENIPCLGWVTPELENSNEEEWIRATSQGLNLDLITLPADQYWPLKPGVSSSSLPYMTFYQEAWVATYLEMKKQDKAIMIAGSMGDLSFGLGISNYSDLLLGLHWLELGRQIRSELSRGNRKHYSWKTPFAMATQGLRSYIHGLFPTTKKDFPVPWLNPAHKSLYEQARHANRKPLKLGLPGRVQRLWALSNPNGIQYFLPIINLAKNFGIERRSPLWDHRIVEFALQLPTNQTSRAGVHKFILRNAMRGVLPDKVIQLRKILPNPLHHRGMRERSVEQVQRLMTNMKLAEMGFVLPDVLQLAYQNYLTKKNNDEYISQTLMLESQLRAWS